MPPPPPRKKSAPPARKPEPVIPKRDLFRAAEQPDLLSVDKAWEQEWQGMPEYERREMMPFHTLYVHFENREDIKKFSEMIGQKISEETKYIWHPKKQQLRVAKLRFKSDK